MDDNATSGVSVDGLTAPVSASGPSAAEPSFSPKPRTQINMTMLIVLIAAVLYAVPGLLLLALFPRTDGALAGLQSAGTLLYAVGGLLWILLGAAGYLRIKSLKDHPRMSFFALIRLTILAVPMVLLSILVVVLISIPPRLQLEITAPTIVDEMVAPVSVTFGMATALQYFASQNLVPLKYEWDYDNDSKVDLETFDPVSTYIVSRAGVYNVVVKVTMTNGAVKRVLRRLIVSRSSFGLQPARPIIDEPVTFTLGHLFPKTTDPAAANLQEASWDFDADGTVDMESAALTATHTFRRVGPQVVSVGITLSNQTQQSLSRTVVVTEPPSQPFPVTLETEPITLIGPPPFGVFFTIKTKEPVASVSWDFGDQKAAEGLRVAHQFAAVGSYTVSASVRSESGAIAKLTKLVRVTEALEIRDLGFEGSIAVRNFTIEGPVPLTVDLTPTTIQSLITFSWDAPGATEVAVSGKSLHAVYRDEGQYVIDLLGIDPEEKVFRKRLTVQALPPSSFVEFTMVPTAPIAPALVTFDASDTFVPTGEQVTGFEWDFGDNAAGRIKFSGARTDHLYENPGAYEITLTVRTIKNNSYTGKKTLVVRPPLLDACFVPSRSSGKAPLGVRFDPTCATGDFTLYRWNFGDGSESDQKGPTHVFEESGTFLVTLTATTASGQSSTASATITVTQ